MIHVQHGDAVTVVTIDRPERRNAVDLETLGELGAATAGAVEREDRALVLTGAGGHFCAGADLTGLEDAGFAGTLHTVLTGLQEAPLVTIAAVAGAALGAGTQLAAACDLRVAVPDARFGIPAARLGLMVDRWTLARLSALAGESTARAMLVAAEVLTGADAHRIGFVNRLGELDDAVAWAREIASLAPITLQGHKLGLNGLADPDGGEAYQEAFRRAWSSEDVAEGRAAFRERRAPRFRGR